MKRFMHYVANGGTIIQLYGMPFRPVFSAYESGLASLCMLHSLACILYSRYRSRSACYSLMQFACCSPERLSGHWIVGYGSQNGFCCRSLPPCLIRPRYRRLDIGSCAKTGCSDLIDGSVGLSIGVYRNIGYRATYVSAFRIAKLPHNLRSVLCRQLNLICRGIALRVRPLYALAVGHQEISVGSDEQWCATGQVGIYAVCKYLCIISLYLSLCLDRLFTGS